MSQFEGIFEDLHSGMHALAVSNGSVALHLALVALGLEEGDEVIVPSITFAASANSVIHAGGVPVFCEIDPKTWCINPEEAKKLISSRTRAIMPVHLYGQPCDLSALKNLCVQNKLLMIEDCAEALGSKWQAVEWAHSEMHQPSVFSETKRFLPEKEVWFYSEMKRFIFRQRFCGITGCPKISVTGTSLWVITTGLQICRLLLVSLRWRDLSRLLRKKIKIFKIYEESFSDVAGISRLPVQVGQTLHSNWLYGVVLDDKLDRDLIMDELLEYGIETRPFFYPLHSMNPYKNFKPLRK